MMKPRDQVRLFFETLMTAYFNSKEHKRKRGKDIHITKYEKKLNISVPAFDEKSNSFSLPQTSLAQSQKLVKKEERGTLLWITGDKNIWKGKVPKREKLTNHYFYQVDHNIS